MLNSSKTFDWQIRLPLLSREFSAPWINDFPSSKPPFLVDFPRMFPWFAGIWSRFSQVSLWPAEWYAARHSWSRRAFMIISRRNLEENNCKSHLNNLRGQSWNIYIYIYLCVCVYLNIDIHIYIYVYIYIHIYVCMCVRSLCLHTFIIIIIIIIYILLYIIHYHISLSNIFWCTLNFTWNPKNKHGSEKWWEPIGSDHVGLASAERKSNSFWSWLLTQPGWLDTLINWYGIYVVDIWIIYG